jgi:ABC-type sugar transport system permease subunit
MATTAQNPVSLRETTAQPTPILWGVVAWQCTIALALFGAAGVLLTVEAFFNLGVFVPRFVAVISALAGVATLASAVGIARLSNGGRLLGIVIHFAAFGVGLLVLGQILGLYLGIDELAFGVYRNAWLLLGFPIGYALVWFGRRFPEGDAAHETVQKVGLAVMMLTLAAVLWGVGLPNSIVTLIQRVAQPQAVLALVAIVLCFLAGRTLIRSGELFGETILQREAWQGWLFLLPNFINFFLFFALPLVLSLYLSFTSYDVVSEAQFIGFDNYGRLLSMDAQFVPDTADARDLLRQNHREIMRIDFGANDLVIGAREPVFWESMGRTFRYCIMLLVLSIVPALGLALLLNSRIPGMTLFRAIYFLPSIAAVVGVALIWQWLYDPVIGYINYAITTVTGWLGIADPGILWLTDENIMLISVVIMASWQIVGFNTVILLAGLQGVPKELIEASTVDGANGWTRLRKIILPLLAPTTFFVTVTTLVSGLQVFSEMFTLFANSVSDQRLSVVFYLYREGFQGFRMGFASATAWILFVVIFAITLIQFRINQSNRAYSD